jgi:hypothetical protein
MAHYLACDHLELDADTVADLGRATFQRSSGALLGTTTRLATTAGASPWTVLPYFQRFWLRGFDGGGIHVVKLGPKEARIEVARCGFCQSRYFRNALRGLVSGVLDLFCTKSYVHVRPGATESALSLRAQWA